MSTTESERLKLLKAQLAACFDKNVFVMMRFGKESIYREIEQTIRSTLHDAGLHPLLARPHTYDPLLWNNIVVCMQNSRYGIAVFENIAGEPTHNPNVALELGYMLAADRTCCILKEEGFTLQADILGRIWTTFDKFHVRKSIKRALEDWIENQVDPIALRPPESITNADEHEVWRQRSHRIVQEYERLLKKNPHTLRIRLAGILSSLAVPDQQHEDSQTPNDVFSVQKRERDLLTQLLDRGARVDCIICPRLYVDRVLNAVQFSSTAQSFWLPRFDALISMVERYSDESRLRIIWSEQLPRNSLIICGNETVFLTTRTTYEHRSRTVVIHDPVIVEHETVAFNNTFDDTVELYKAIENIMYKGPKLWRTLKNSVLKELRKQRQKLLEGSGIG
jgi:hypothetical protein